MHTEMFMAGFLLALTISLLGFLILRKLVSFRDRRLMQLFILAAPALLLGMLVFDIAYMAAIGCLWRDTPLDIFIGAGLGLGLGLAAFGSFAHHVWTVWKARKLFRDLPVSSTASPSPRLAGAQALLEGLSKGHPVPRLRLLPFERPLAFTIGLFRPTIVLSQWVLDALDEQELEGVLAHEWIHCLHRDNFILTVAAWLRDCTRFLFTTNRALKSLLAEKELHADACASQLTGRPAALASALYKFGKAPSLQLFNPSVEAVVQGFGKDLIETRIQALLGNPVPDVASIRSWELVLMLVFLMVFALLPSYWMPMLH